MDLPNDLALPVPRQPTVAVRHGRAYRAFAMSFMVLLTVAIILFIAPFLPGVPTAWHWPLWIAAAVVITLTAPLRSWGIRKGLLSYFVHGTAVMGRVIAVESAGDRTWTLRFAFPVEGRGEVEASATLYDAPEAPLAEGDPVPVLHRAHHPEDAVLPTLAGILPD